MDNRRKHGRSLCTLDVTYSPLSDIYATPVEFGSGQATDLGRQGICILLDRRIKVPQMVQLRVDIPGKPPILVLGKTVHCGPAPNSSLFKIGFKFVGLLPADFDEVIKDAMMLSADWD